MASAPRSPPTLASALPAELRQRLDSRNGGKAPDSPRGRGEPHAAAAAAPKRAGGARGVRARAAGGGAPLQGGKENAAAAEGAARGAPARGVAPSASPSQCVLEVERMRLRREARRSAVEEQRRARADDDGTFEFQRMIEQYRAAMAREPRGEGAAEPPGTAQRIRVVVRKRPLLPSEAAEYDVVSCAPGGAQIVVHEPRLRVDLSKDMESHAFDVDEVYADGASTAAVYRRTAGPLVCAMFDGCSATCFAYGQTGSGKTHTMLGHKAADGAREAVASAARAADALGSEAQGEGAAPDELGLFHLAARDCFAQLEVLRASGVCLYLGVSFYEVYCGAVHDLLHRRQQCRVLESAEGEVVVRGLEELVPASLAQLLELTSAANEMRRVGTTSANEHSSRSHAVLQLTLRLAETGAAYGRFCMVDLAGSERAADSAEGSRSTRTEGAEINKSLLCLKECIRALGAGQGHTPFRGSKLTQVLRAAFTAQGARCVMIANISPASANVEHTLNTLRYATRLRGAPAASAGGAGGDAPAPPAAAAAAAAARGRAARGAGGARLGGRAASPRAPSPRHAPGGARTPRALSARELQSSAAPSSGGALHGSAVLGGRASARAQRARPPTAPAARSQSALQPARGGAEGGAPARGARARASADGLPRPPRAAPAEAAGAEARAHGEVAHTHTATTAVLAAARAGGAEPAAGAGAGADADADSAAAPPTPVRAGGPGSGDADEPAAAPAGAAPMPAPDAPAAAPSPAADGSPGAQLAAEARVAAARRAAEAGAAELAEKGKHARALSVLTEVLRVAYDPDAWAQEMALLEEHSACLADAAEYALHLDEVLASRVQLFHEMRAALHRFSSTLATPADADDALS